MVLHNWKQVQTRKITFMKFEINTIHENMLFCFCSTFKFQRENVDKLDGVLEKLCYVLPWCSSMGPLGEVRGWSPPVPRYLTRFNKGRKFSSFIAWISYKLKHSTLTKRRQRQWQHQHQQRGVVLPFRDTWRTTIKEDNSSLNGIEKISSKVVKLMISCHNIEQLFANSQWCILWTLNIMKIPPNEAMFCQSVPSAIFAKRIYIAPCFCWMWWCHNCE